MDSNQRNTIVVAAVGVALLAGGIGFAIGRASVDEAPIADVAIRPTIGSPTPVGPTATPTEVVLSTQGRILAPGSGAVRPLPEDAACALLASPGTTAECGELATSGPRAVWLIETAPAGNGATARAVRVLTYVPDEGGWVTRLEAADPGGESWAEVGAVSTDVTGDGAQELVVGFRDTSGSLGYDIVGTSPGGVPEVLAHAGPLAQGRVVFDGGLIDFDETAPGTFERRTFAFSSGLFRAVEVVEVPVSTAPQSQLG